MGVFQTHNSPSPSRGKIQLNWIQRIHTKRTLTCREGGGNDSKGFSCRRTTQHPQLPRRAPGRGGRQLMLCGADTPRGIQKGTSAQDMPSFDSSIGDSRGRELKPACQVPQSRLPPTHVVPRLRVIWTVVVILGQLLHTQTLCMVVPGMLLSAYSARSRDIKVTLSQVLEGPRCDTMAITDSRSGELDPKGSRISSHTTATTNACGVTIRVPCNWAFATCWAHWRATDIVLIQRGRPQGR